MPHICVYFKHKYTYTYIRNIHNIADFSAHLLTTALHYYVLQLIFTCLAVSCLTTENRYLKIHLWLMLWQVLCVWWNMEGNLQWNFINYRHGRFIQITDDLPITRAGRWYQSCADGAKASGIRELENQLCISEKCSSKIDIGTCGSHTMSRSRSSSNI